MKRRTTATPRRAPDPPRPRLHGEYAKRWWLPEGKTCAVVFTVDDVHPGRSTDAYEAGGDLEKGALRHVAWLLQRQPDLHVTLFVTPDWRQISPFPTRKLVARIPLLRDRVPLAPMLPKGTMRLDRHPEFVRYVRALARTDTAPHGLHHCSVGPRIGTEFQEQSVRDCERMIGEASDIFVRAGLPAPSGNQVPLWNLTGNFVTASAAAGVRWLAGGRDLFTPPADDAPAGMNGPSDASMLHPTIVGDGRVVLFTTNFQATSDVDRAYGILDLGGVLAVKAHIIKRVGSYVAMDGIDEVYRAYLDALFRLIKSRYGDRVWFTTMREISERVHSRLRSRDEGRSFASAEGR